MAQLGSTSIYGDLDVKNNNIKQVAKINEVTAIQLSYLENVTSNLQIQLDNKLTKKALTWADLKGI